MSDPVMQHFVPKMYLNYFSGSDGYVHVYPRDGGNYFLSKPENIAKERHLYTDLNSNSSDVYEMEKELGSVEANAAPAFSRLISGQRISFEEKCNVSEYICAQAVRTPLYMENLAKLMALADLQDGSLGVVRDRHSVLDAANEEAVVDIPRSVGMSALRLVSSMAERVSSLRWRLLKSKDPTFVTSDEPVVKLTGFALEDVLDGDFEMMTGNINIIFPICPQAVLYISPSINLSEEMKVHAGTVKEINRKIILNSNRHVYSYKRDVGIEKYIEKVKDTKRNKEVDFSAYGFPKVKTTRTKFTPPSPEEP